MKTLLLDRMAWDLVKDASGSIAVAGNPYSVAQGAACAIKLFAGELWYDTTKGVPYWAQILGKAPPLPLVKAQAVAAALTVPDAASAACFIQSANGRQTIGQIQVTDSVTGLTAAAGFTR